MTVSYTGLVLTADSRQRLMRTIDIPDGWEVVLHHVTLNMGPFKGNRDLLGQEFKVRVDTQASDDKVMAVGVDLPAGITSKNARPHITVAVNRAGGGKPVMSNNLKDWTAIPSMTVDTVLEEVEMGADPKRVAGRHLRASTKGVFADIDAIQRAYDVLSKGISTNGLIGEDEYVKEIQNRLDSLEDSLWDVISSAKLLQTRLHEFADDFDTSLGEGSLTAILRVAESLRRSVNGH